VAVGTALSYQPQLKVLDASDKPLVGKPVIAFAYPSLEYIRPNAFPKSSDTDMLRALDPDKIAVLDGNVAITDEVSLWEPSGTLYK
jgi:hypothetical protein